MARKNESPQKAAMREMMRSYLKDNDISIKNGTDVTAVMRDMMLISLTSSPDSSMLDGSRSTPSSWCRILLEIDGFIINDVLHDDEERVGQVVGSAVTERHG